MNEQVHHLVSDQFRHYARKGSSND
jgi:hypothetical protein